MPLGTLNTKCFLKATVVTSTNRYQLISYQHSNWLIFCPKLSTGVDWIDFQTINLVTCNIHEIHEHITTMCGIHSRSNFARIFVYHLFATIVCFFSNACFTLLSFYYIIQSGASKVARHRYFFYLHKFK